MGGLSKAKKKVRKLHKKIERNINPITGMPLPEKINPFAKQADKKNEKIEETTDKYLWGPDAEEEAAKQQAETNRLIESLRPTPDKVIPMADEEELMRRRRRQRSRGGRADTVLSDALGG